MLSPPDMDIITPRLQRKLIDPCATCHGTGWVYDGMDEDFRRERAPCECRRRFMFAVGLRLGNIPPEFWGVEQMDIEHNKPNFKVVKDYCEDLDGARRNGKGFTMFGENGAGKTAMATYILARALREGFSASYMTAHDYISGLTKAWGNPALREWLDDLVDTDFMVLDEMGKEWRRDDDARRADLDTLLRTRRGNMKPTIIITNYSVGDFRESYGASIVSILADRNRNMVFVPGDYRKRKHGT